jgi:flagellar protein FliS
MSQNKNQLAYQEAAVRNADAAELVIMLHDILVRDLHAAIAAIETKDIEKRSAKLKHGFLVLARLEGALNMEEDGAEKIARFFVMARAQMMKAQAQQDADILRELAGLVAENREAWVQAHSRHKRGDESMAPAAVRKAGYEMVESSGASWKA